MLRVHVCQNVIVNYHQSCFRTMKFPVCKLEHWIQIILSATESDQQQHSP